MLTFGSSIINDLPLVVHLVLLIETFFVENAGVGVVGVLHAENTMAPTVLDNSVALAKENLLGLHGIEFLELSFYISEFSTSLGRAAKISGINEKPGLRIFEVLNPLGGLSEMSLSLGLIVKRLPMVLHCRHRVSLLKR